jgi:hypothetical protein
MNSEKPARHGYRGRRKYDARPTWEAEKFRLLVLYRAAFYEHLMDGKSVQRTPHTRGQYRRAGAA